MEFVSRGNVDCVHLRFVRKHGHRNVQWTMAAFRSHGLFSAGGGFRRFAGNAYFAGISTACDPGVGNGGVK